MAGQSKVYRVEVLETRIVAVTRYVIADSEDEARDLATDSKPHDCVLDCDDERDAESVEAREVDSCAVVSDLDEVRKCNTVWDADEFLELLES